MQRRSGNIIREGGLKKPINVGYGTCNIKHRVHGFARKRRKKISYKTGGTWILITPARENTKFKRGTGAYYGMPDIYMSKNVNAVSMFQPVIINYEGYTKKEVDTTILEQKVQAGVSHTSDAEFKNMVRNKLLDNCPLNLSTTLTEITYLAQTLQD